MSFGGGHRGEVPSPGKQVKAARKLAAFLDRCYLEEYAIRSSSTRQAGHGMPSRKPRRRLCALAGLLAGPRRGADPGVAEPGQVGDRHPRAMLVVTDTEGNCSPAQTVPQHHRHVRAAASASNWSWRVAVASTNVECPGARILRETGCARDWLRRRYGRLAPRARDGPLSSRRARSAGKRVFRSGISTPIRVRAPGRSCGAEGFAG